MDVGGNKFFFGGYMSSDCQREMTLQEWVDRLPEIHRARKEYAALVTKVEKFTSTNNARDEIVALYGAWRVANPSVDASLVDNFVSYAQQHSPVA
jgi:hypothetical protein